MRTILTLVMVMIVLIPSVGLGYEQRAYMMRQDYGTETLAECILQYYYYIPCPTYSWFWGFYHWTCGDIIGTVFNIGDISTGGWDTCNDSLCYYVTGVKVLDFAGYGAVYPGFYTVRFDVYCADEDGCPIGDVLGTSGDVETGPPPFKWNDIEFIPPIDISDCFANPGPPPTQPRILVTATHVGSDCSYPEWGSDNISTPLQFGCEMHAFGCLPALYPRPTVSHYTSVHSGYYGNGGFVYCPPQGFTDGLDTSPPYNTYGFVELTWRLTLTGEGCSLEPSSWSNVKTLYR